MESPRSLISSGSRFSATPASAYDFLNRQYEKLEPLVSHRKQTTAPLSIRQIPARARLGLPSTLLRLFHFPYPAHRLSKSSLTCVIPPFPPHLRSGSTITPLTSYLDSGIFTRMSRATSKNGRRSPHGSSASRKSAKPLKHKALGKHRNVSLLQDSADPAILSQLNAYEEALRNFQQQKFQRAKIGFEKVVEGPNKELLDRARVHLRICDQRISPASEPSLKSAEDHYNQGIAMMNLGRWDDAREHLDRARKAAPKADHIVYAMAALDCLTGEAESSMQNLKFAIQLRPENRFRARNDEDFAFLQEDPRFTELLYPEREGSRG